MNAEQEHDFETIRVNLDRALELLNGEIRVIGDSDDRGSYLRDTRGRVLDAIGSLESYRASCRVAKPFEFAADFTGEDSRVTPPERGA